MNLEAKRLTPMATTPRWLIKANVAYALQQPWASAAVIPLKHGQIQ